MRPAVLAALFACAACSSPVDDAIPAAKAQAGGAAPVVIELFQSQGCSSCPPANANVNALAARADVLALSYAVTYWNHLGWKDTPGRSSPNASAPIIAAARATASIRRKW